MDDANPIDRSHRRCPSGHGRLRVQKTRPIKGLKHGLPGYVRTLICATCGFKEDEVIFQKTVHEARWHQFDAARRKAEEQVLSLQQQLATFQERAQLQLMQRDLERVAQSLQKAKKLVDQRLQ